ncbi:MAG: hypothetical protein O3C45_05635 [Bacteroidetes bacterium]|nr:hypothetical protein [Bacteroidota bacterium]MDA0874529.1 hypothetical protein [Bacteroidota bacterium]
MALSVDIIRMILTVLFSAALGGLAGYALAWHRLRKKRLDLIQRVQEHRRNRLAWHREQYQASTSRIHRPATLDSGEPFVTDEALEQLRLEMTILREDHRIETQLLQEENRELRDAVERAKAADATFTDLPQDVAGQEVAPAPEDAVVAEDAVLVSDNVVALDDVLPEDDAVTHDAILAANDVLADDGLTTDAIDETPVEGIPVSAPADASPRVPEDIQALFMDEAVKDKPIRKPRVKREKPVEAIPPPAAEEVESLKENPLEPASTFDTTVEAAAEIDPAPDTDRAADPLPGTTGIPLEQDASGFHFHWEAPRLRKDDRPSTKPTLSRTDMPTFRSLYDMLQASGVSLSPEASPAGSDALLDPVHHIVGLDRDSYALLQELGYASLEQLARLSETETRRLAAVFRIPAERIRLEWTPSAQARLQEDQADRGV